MTALVRLTIGLAVLLSFRPQVVLGFQHGWVPDPAKLAHSAIFLLFGVLLFRTRGLLELTRRLAPFSLAAAVAVFALLLPRIRAAMASGQGTAFDPVLGTLLAAFAVAATFGHLGAGLRWLDRPMPGLARFAAASFWIYLVHHPLMGLLQVVLRPVAIPPVAKFGLVFVGTLGLCLLSYGRLVESRLLGRLLDGELPWRAFRRGQTSVLPLPAPAESRRAA